ncbi:phosphotransferase enzyme family protein [Fusarium austroafricanum]|uniref:Phosphotransferase enzyme family protein n=1 Tax=Fusarium austroafricanum TaxID=2364996 RepID=A0A8H4NWJ6_9HYPO|nr:phosphotransferase enzyme family protein [Fusarium austroafricanum]
MGYFDEIAEKIGDDQWDEWKKRVLEASGEIASFVAHRGSGGDSKFVNWFEGSFNFCLRVTFQNSEPDSIIRFPGPGHTTFRDEKVTNEVNVIKFLHEQTNIPIPRLLSWGLTKDSPHHFGPFIISEFGDGVHLSDILKDPAYKRHLYLNPNIDGRLLENAFEQMSDILLQLHQFDFPAIGAISKDESSNTWSVARRPLTYSMNELATTAFYPVEDFATSPFTSTSDYFRYLSRQHITHLRAQRNLSASREEAREQYIVRHLFALLIDKYTTDDHGPFKLFCDDLRPQNILVDPKTMRINAVLNLEFTNTMPSQYASEPPWWLLLAGPDSYLIRGRTMEDFQAAYEPFLELFLKAMQRVESANGLQHHASLSRLMREGWSTKRFWFNYAARKPFDVEDIFNSFLNDDSKGIECLDDETRGALEAFVQTKVEQLKAYDEECKLLL